MKKTIVEIKPKWNAEDATMKVSTDKKKVHLEMFDNTGEYAEMWIDRDDVIKLHEHLGNFISALAIEH
jgi:N-acetylmuramoyl-L-alanine amidase CwlA